MGMGSGGTYPRGVVVKMKAFSKQSKYEM